MKKKLLKLIKTQHFQRRQKERNISDRDVKKTLREGVKTVTPDGLVSSHNGIDVISTPDGKLVTCVGEGAKTTKVLAKSTGKAIKKNMKPRSKAKKVQKITCTYEIPLEEYLKKKP